MQGRKLRREEKKVKNGEVMRGRKVKKGTGRENWKMRSCGKRKKSGQVMFGQIEVEN